MSQRLDLRKSDKYVALQNVPIYYTWQNIRKQYKNNKPKIIGPIRNDEFELPDGSYSLRLYKKHETLTTIPNQ